MEQDKVLIIGGCGFVGSHTAEEAIKQGFEVIILDNLSTGKLENIAHLDIKKVHVGSITDYNTVLKAMEGCTYVIHLGAKISVPESSKFPFNYNDVNIKGTCNVLKACKELEIEKVIFASTSAVYGEQSTPHEETDVTNPMSIYGQTKLIAEKIIALSDVNYTIFRYFNIFGERQCIDGGDGAVIPKFIDLYKNKIPFEIYGDGEQIRDFIYVKDVAKANIDALNIFNSDNKIINLGGHPISINTLISYFKGAKYNFVNQREGDIKISMTKTNLAFKLLNIKQKNQLSPKKYIESQI